MCSDNHSNLAYAMPLDAFDQMLAALGQTSLIFAPTRIAHRGRFSDTDLIRYAPVRSVRQIEYRVKSDYSAKEVVFPINQVLFHFVQDQQIEPRQDTSPILLLVRPCDIHAFERLDDVFLRNGPHPDPYYQALRQRVRFVLMECADGFENCFCVSMGCNSADEYALAVRFEADTVRVLIRDKQMVSAVPLTARLCDFTPKFVTEDRQAVRVPDVHKMDEAVRHGRLFEHEMWKEYARRCIACGRCNTHCPTCSCFTTFDVDGDDQSGQRRRTWASCHVERFTTMAGGHVFREDIGSRMRFKVMHKIYDFPQRFGKSMCVGCGRCDDACPEYINLRTCINKLAPIVEHEDGRK